MVPNHPAERLLPGPSVAIEDLREARRFAEVLAFEASAEVVEVADTERACSPHERPQAEGLVVEHSVEAVEVVAGVAVGVVS